MSNDTHKKTRRIAVGGSADIYLVYDEKLEVHRVIKVLKAGSGEETRKRIETEAKISVKLRHPNIVETYGVGVWDYGAPYIEMEYVDGDSVERLLEESPGGLPPKAALLIAYGVSKALRYLADKTVTINNEEYCGLIHRDVKPSNILVIKKYDADGVWCGVFPKLIDFGVSRPAAVSILTVHGGAPIGTFAYMAPEQFDGGTIDCGVDIYALGAVLYEMLTGQKAFPQDDLKNLLLRKMTGSYAPLKSSVYGGIAKIVKKCLAVNRKDRYATAGELCDAIEKELTARLSNGTRLAKLVVLCTFIAAAVGAAIIVFFGHERLAARTVLLRDPPDDSLADAAYEENADDLPTVDGVLQTEPEPEETANLSYAPETAAQPTDPADTKLDGVWAQDTRHPIAGNGVQLIVKKQYAEAAALLYPYAAFITVNYYIALALDKLYRQNPSDDNYAAAADAYNALIAKCAGYGGEKYCAEGVKRAEFYKNAVK